MNEELPAEEETKYYPVYRQISDDCRQAIKDGRRIVEGTAFVGFNREQLRIRGKRNDPKGVVWNVKERRWVPTDDKGGSKWAGSRKPVEHPLVTERKARAAEAENVDVERPLLAIAKKEPMTLERRYALYGPHPTPAQVRRLTKKSNKAQKAA